MTVLAGRNTRSSSSAAEVKAARPNNLARSTTPPVCTLGTNLIINGDAEADPTATADGFINHDVSAWENEIGEFTLARWGASGGFPANTDPGPANRGTFMFVAGFTETSSGSQVIDLSNCASQIDSGIQQFKLSGFIGGFGPQNDSPRVIVTFKNAANVAVGTASIGYVTGAERNNATALVERKSTGTIPAGTRSVDVLLQMTRFQGSYNDGYADSISLLLSEPSTCSSLPSGAAAWWKAEGNANDVLGVNNGVLQNGTTFSPGLVGQAFSFDGTDDNVSVSRSIQDDFTIEFWLNTTQIVGTDSGQWYEGRGLVDGEVQTVTNDFGVTLQNGKVLFGVGNPDVTIRSGFVADGNWHHVAATRLRNTGEMKLYVDGVHVAAATAGTQSLTTPPRLTLGRVQVDNNPFQGKLDEVALYTRVLSLQEIQAIYEAGNAGKCVPGTIQAFVLNPISVNGGQSSIGTVTLASAAPAGGAIVNLSSDNAAVATVPPSFTISEGQTSGTFTVTTSVPTSDVTALISASYQTSSTSASLTVLAPRPDLTVTAATVPSSAQTDAGFNVSWTVKNQGSSQADPPWIDRVFLSSDNQLGNDTLIAEFPFNSNLAPNQTTDRIQSLTIPRNAVSQDGAYFLLVQTDANNQLNEGNGEGNNFVARPITITRPPKPDLVVDSIVAPNSAFFGQTILVQYTVRNIGGGPTNAAAWQDFAYLSVDDVPEIEDPFKIPVTNVNFLSSGETYTATVEVKIPQGLVGQYKIIVWTDGDGTNHRSNIYPHQVVEEDDENNYGIARPIQINAPPVPDLRTTNVVAPEEVFAGGQMPLTWRVENLGDGVTPPDQSNSVDKIYLSQNMSLDVNTDRLVGVRPRSGALAQNEGYTVTNFNVTLPNDIAGDWYVFILADGDNQIYEFNNENNNANYDSQQPGSPMHIHATPPDLIVLNSLTAPANVSTGQSFSIGWTVKNQGAFEAAPNWFEGIYLSADPTLNVDSDTLLTSVFRGSSLGPGLTYDVTANVTVPSCISGTYYLFVLTDNRHQIFEFDPGFDAEANNSSQPRLIQIVDATPDLRVTSVGNPASGNAGQQVSVSWTGANQGTGGTVGTKWTDRIYLSPTQTLDTATALLIGSFDHIGALNNGETYTRTENLTVPSTAQGSYFVIVLTDANNEIEECANKANNTGISSQSITISNNLPDLVVQTASSQANPVGGQTISVDFTVANQGAIAINSALWGDAVYFSPDPALSNDDVRLATSAAVGPMAIGETYNRQVQATLPVVAPGNYFLIIRADYLGNVFEGQHEDNNLRTVAISIQSPAVDLMVTAVDAPSSALSGQDMLVNYTVLNNGASVTVGSHWIDEIVVSLDQIDDPTDLVIASKQHNGALNGQASYNDSQSVFVPQGLTGQYYVFVRTDRRNETAESNENNNSAADGTFFSLTPPADLLVSTINAPANGSPGEPLTVGWTTTNNGPNSATGSWSDGVYLSQDQTWDINDLLLGRQTRTGPIASGGNYNGQLTATLPAINLGNYYVIVKTDSQNRVRETNDGNNTSVANSQTAIDVTALQLGVPLNTTLITGQERFYKTLSPAGETLRFSLEGQAGSANELFARFGLIASRTSYDFSFSRLNEANQEIVVPNSQAGNYFPLARSEFSTPSPQNVTIKAEVIPFGITSVSPNRIGDNGQVTITLKGARFEEGATVQLSGNGTTLNAAKVIRVDSSTVKARFMFTNAPHGAYDVVLTNPNSQSTVAIQAVSMETATEPTIEMDGARDTAFPRFGRSTRWTGTLRNSGNVDIQYLEFGVNTEPNLDVVMLQTRDSLPNQNYLPDGENRMRVSFFRDVAPNEERTVGYSIEGYDSAFEVSIGYSIQTKTEFLLQSQTESELLRLRMLNNPNLPPVLADSVNSPTAWWQTFKLFYTNLGLIDEDPQLNINAVKKAKDILARKEKFDKISIAQNESCNGICDSVFESCYVEASNDYLKKLIEIFQDYFTDILSCRLSIEAPLCIAIAERDLTIKLSVNLGVYAARLIMCGYDYQQCKCHCESKDNEELGCGFTRSACFPFVRFKYCPVFPVDPNEKIGPSGFGSQAFVGTQSLMPYTINFENVSTATAHAQRIRITDQLDPNLDWRTLRLGEIGFKQYRFQVPDNRAFFQQRVQLGPDLGNLLADISAGIDISTGTVTWTLTAIDPTTGEQPNGVNLGLLPPNNESNDGQGFVTFTVKPKSTIASGVVIHNGATITFDTEAPIDTNVVSNTIDAEAPSSAVNSLPATQPNPTFEISWSGADAPNGSGLLSYDIFFSANNGPYHTLVSGTTALSTQFTGELSTTYRFYSIARDNAGNVETAPNNPDTATTIGAAASSVSNVSGIGIYGGTANLSATLTSGGTPLSNRPITFTLNGLSVGSANTVVNGVAILSGVSLGGINAGTYPTAIGASFAGDANYAASSGIGSLIVNESNQTIAFGALGNKAFGDADFMVSASATSGLAVSFAANGQCTLSSGTVHITAAGGCTITASQVGNGNYNAAVDVPQSFIISKAATITVVSSSIDPSAEGESVTFTGTLTSTAGTPTGIVQFKADAINLGAPVALNQNGVATFATSSLSVGPHVITADYSGDANFNSSMGSLTDGQLVGGVIQFQQASSTVNESSDFATITVTRTGNTSAPATVKYATSDATDVNFICNPATAGQIAGAASRKCDYHIAVGRLRFAAGETSKQIILSIVNDVYVEPTEVLTIALSSPTGATLGTSSTATLNIIDTDAGGGPNPIDSTPVYVRMLYVDLLSREPEPAGLAGWIHRIDFCGQPGEPPPPCDRVTVGGDGFLRSAEFFDREFFVIRLYRAGLGRIPRYDDVGDLAYVSGFLTDADLELNKQELVTEIMSRTEFGSLYNGLSDSAYVDKLIQTAAVTIPQSVRDGWVTALTGATKTRAQVYRELSERQEVSDKYLHEAQVVSCYYGFFTRNPDGAYFNFLDRLDRGEINLGDLANAFINAAEYRQRFGP
jgi:hypothetical protein